MQTSTMEVMALLTHCSGVFGSQNSTAIEKLMGIARNWGKSVDNVQANDGPLTVGEVHADF